MNRIAAVALIFSMSCAGGVAFAGVVSPMISGKDDQWQGCRILGDRPVGDPGQGHVQEQEHARPDSHARAEAEAGRTAPVALQQYRL